MLLQVAQPGEDLFAFGTPEFAVGVVVLTSATSAAVGGSTGCRWGRLLLLLLLDKLGWWHAPGRAGIVTTKIAVRAQAEVAEEMIATCPGDNEVSGGIGAAVDWLAAHGEHASPVGLSIILATLRGHSLQAAISRVVGRSVL